jgi:hypothetical protein
MEICVTTDQRRHSRLEFNNCRNGSYAGSSSDGVISRVGDCTEDGEGYDRGGDCDHRDGEMVNIMRWC